MAQRSENTIPSMMKAAVLLGPGRLAVREVPVPKPGQGEVLIRVRACAICGTDPKIVAHGWPGQPPYGQFVPGHEYTGEVVALGPDVDELGVGDRVAVEPHKGCGRCDNCIKGMYTICLNYGRKEKGHRHLGFTSNGGYAEYAVAHVNALHKVPDTVGFEEATLATTAGTAIYGIERAGWIAPGDRVVVVGPGPIGLVAVQVARASGAARVVLVGTREERLKAGRDCGADATVNVNADGAVTAIKEALGGYGADLVIESAGTPAGAELSLDLARKGGRIALLGIFSEKASLDMNKIVQGNLTVVGGKAEGMRACARALSLIERGLVSGKHILTHRYELDQIEEAFSVYSGRTGGAIKVVVVP